MRSSRCESLAAWLVLLVIACPCIAQETVTLEDLAAKLEPAKASDTPQADATKAGPVRPVPDEASVRSAQELIKQAYESEYKAAAENAGPLISKLLTTAGTTADPAREYALFIEAEKLAIAQRDATLAMEIVDLRAATYEIPRYSSRIRALVQLTAGKDRLSLKELYGVCLSLEETATGALSADQPEDAQQAAELLTKFARLLQAAARRDKDGTRETDATRFREIGDGLAKDSISRLGHRRKFESAQATLATSPDDPMALMVIAHYLCFVSNDWEKGLAALARTDHPTLAEIAAKELELRHFRGDNDAGTAAATFNVATLWWNAADDNSLPKDDAIAVKRHASALYATVQGALPDELENALAAKRASDDPSPRKGAKDAWPSAIGQAYQNSIGMRLLYIPSGKFVMGPAAMDSRRGQQQVPVRITKPFLMAESEVTLKQWNAVMAEGDSATIAPPSLPQSGPSSRPAMRPTGGMAPPPPPAAGGGLFGAGGMADGRGAPVLNGSATMNSGDTAEDAPVRNISPQQVLDFCERLTALEQKAKRIPKKASYKLPFEAQWEHACRAGTQTRYSFGDDEDAIDSYGWTSSSSDSRAPRPVKQKRPNAWGLYDMHGNVAEICDSFYSEELAGGDDPTGARNGASVVIKGGGYADSASNACRSDSRGSLRCDRKASGTGFRIILEGW